MSDDSEADAESVKMALDQLTQTLDVMRRVVERLKLNVVEAENFLDEDLQSVTDSPSEVVSKENISARDRRVTDNQVRHSGSGEDRPDVEGGFVYDTPIILH